MYRIRQTIPETAELAALYACQAEDQTNELLKRVTDAELGNFDTQTQSQNLAFVEEVVIGGLRTHYALTSPTGPKARERHYASLVPRIQHIAGYASGLSYQEIAEQTGDSPEHVEKSIANTIGLLTDGTFKTSKYFATEYWKRHRKFRADKYAGLLGVIRFTESHLASGESEGYMIVSDTLLEPSPAKIIRRRRRQDPDEDGSLSRDSLGQYLYNISKVPLLTAEKEVELAKRIEGGLVANYALSTHKADLTEQEIEELEWLHQDGELAEEHFYLANLRLVVSIAKKFRERPSMTYGDLIQEGNLGLKRAIQKFDYTRGYKFSTYATPWIKQSITRGIAAQADVIRKPVRVNEDMRALWLIERQFEKQGIECTPEVLAEEMKCGVDYIHNLMTWRKPTVSLDTPIDSGKRFSEGATLLDFITDEAAADNLSEVMYADRHKILLELVSVLDDRAADVILSRYGVGTTSGGPELLHDIGARLGISAERVRQIEKQALNILQARAETADMREAV